MSDFDNDWDDPDELSEEEIEELEHQEDKRAMSPTGLQQENERMLRRYHNFRRAADAVADAWQKHTEVQVIWLIGSLAVAPWKAVPRFQPYRRKRIQIWHECKDIDLAIWLSNLGGLSGLRRTKIKALSRLYQADSSIGVASHHVDVFIFEPGTDRYLGRLCEFNACPKGNRECNVPLCGDTAFLRQHEDFKWRAQALAEDRVMPLFDRATGKLGRAVDAPMPEE